jgi:hypothetical protein
VGKFERMGEKKCELVRKFSKRRSKGERKIGTPYRNENIKSEKKKRLVMKQYKRTNDAGRCCIVCP